MSKYDSLVKYICILDGDSFGSWVIDRENDGTLEHPIQMPYVSYSDMVHHFIDDIYDFIDHNKDMELNRYGDILNQNGLKWGSKSMSTADVSNLDAQCIMALIAELSGQNDSVMVLCLDFSKMAVSGNGWSD